MQHFVIIGNRVKIDKYFFVVGLLNFVHLIY